MQKNSTSMGVVVVVAVVAAAVDDDVDGPKLIVDLALSTSCCSA